MDNAHDVHAKEQDQVEDAELSVGAKRQQDAAFMWQDGSLHPDRQKSSDFYVR